MSPYFDQARSRFTGFTELCGIELDSLEPGEAVCSCTLREELLNPQGIAHGGLLTTVMDVATGSAAIFCGETPRMAVTQSCDVHYLRPVKSGRIRAAARVVKAGRSLALVRAELFDESGRLCAEGSFTYFYLGS